MDPAAALFVSFNARQCASRAGYLWLNTANFAYILMKYGGLKPAVGPDPYGSVCDLHIFPGVRLAVLIHSHFVPQFHVVTGIKILKSFGVGKSGLNPLSVGKPHPSKTWKMVLFVSIGDPSVLITSALFLVLWNWC